VLPEAEGRILPLNGPILPDISAPASLGFLSVAKADQVNGAKEDLRSYQVNERRLTLRKADDGQPLGMHAVRKDIDVGRNSRFPRPAQQNTTVS
jgi:hypothetical protein